MADKRKKSKIKFWISLGIYTLILAVLAVLILKAVWSFAEAYEQAQPGKVIDAYVDKLNQNLWDEGVADTVASMPHEMQTDEECREAIKEILSGEITYVRTTSSEPGLNAYALRCGGGTFGKVYLKQDDTKPSAFKAYGIEINLPYDLRPWVIEKEEFDFSGLYTSIEVTVPEYYSVSLNDHVLGKGYITQDGIEFDALKKYYPYSNSLPHKVTYRYDNIIGTVSPVIFDENGNEVTIDPTRDDSQFLKDSDPGAVARLDDFCSKFLPSYMKYSSGIYSSNPMGGYSDVAQYVKSGSDLDKRLLGALDGMEWAHTYSFKMNDYHFDSALDLGEGNYVCTITGTATSATTGAGENQDTKTFNVIVYDSGKEIRALAIV